MTVQELIAKLMEVEDLDRKLYFYDDSAVLGENRGYREVDEVVEEYGMLVLQ